MVGFISSEDNPIFLPLSADWRFLLFTTMLGVLTCLLCGTAPALQAARSDPGYALKGSGRGSTAGRRGGAGRRGVGGFPEWESTRLDTRHGASSSAPFC